MKKSYFYKGKNFDKLNSLFKSPKNNSLFSKLKNIKKWIILNRHHFYVEVNEIEGDTFICYKTINGNYEILRELINYDYSDFNQQILNPCFDENSNFIGYLQQKIEFNLLALVNDSLHIVNCDNSSDIEYLLLESLSPMKEKNKIKDNVNYLYNLVYDLNLNCINEIKVTKVTKSPVDSRIYYNGLDINNHEIIDCSALFSFNYLEEAVKFVNILKNFVKKFEKCMYNEEKENLYIETVGKIRKNFYERINKKSARYSVKPDIIFNYKTNYETLLVRRNEIVNISIEKFGFTFSNEEDNNYLSIGEYVGYNGNLYFEIPKKVEKFSPSRIILDRNEEINIFTNDGGKTIYGTISDYTNLTPLEYFYPISTNYLLFTEKFKV